MWLYPDIYGTTTVHADFLKQPTGAKPGRKFYSLKPKRDALKSCSIQKILPPFMLPPGSFAEHPTLSVQEEKAAAFTKAPMQEKPGKRFRPACLQENLAALR